MSIFLFKKLNFSREKYRNLQPLIFTSKGDIDWVGKAGARANLTRKTIDRFVRFGAENFLRSLYALFLTFVIMGGEGRCS